MKGLSGAGVLVFGVVIAVLPRAAGPNRRTAARGRRTAAGLRMTPAGRDLTFFLPAAPAADGTYDVVPFADANGGITLQPTQGNVALYVGSSMIAASGTFYVTVVGGKVKAAFSNLEFFTHVQGVPDKSAGFGGGSLTCP